MGHQRQIDVATQSNFVAINKDPIAEENHNNVVIPKEGIVDITQNIDSFVSCMVDVSQNNVNTDNEFVKEPQLVVVSTFETQPGISLTQAEKFVKDSWANMDELDKISDDDSPGYFIGPEEHAFKLVTKKIRKSHKSTKKPHGTRTKVSKSNSCP